VTIEIYTTPTCPFCHAAKDLLRAKSAAFEEIVVVDPDKRAAMSVRVGGRTSVPQIFINGTHIGGCDDLYMLEETGKLAGLLAANTSPGN
jgi:glutaredoxin 3